VIVEARPMSVQRLGHPEQYVAAGLFYFKAASTLLIGRPKFANDQDRSITRNENPGPVL
jgi:hypothetical protein